MSSAFLLVVILAPFAIAAPCQVSTGCDYLTNAIGGSIVNFLGPQSDQDCCAACQATSGCNAWANYAGAFCVLQNVANFVAGGGSPSNCGQVATCVTACGDPHFQGLNGVQYSFQGEVDEAFSLISAPSIEMNSVFVHNSADKVHADNTYIGETCIRSCNDTLRISPTNGISLNGQSLGQLQNGYIVGSASHVSVFQMRNDTYKILVANKWDITVEIMHNTYLNFNKVVALPDATASNPRPAHGVLGHTLGAPVEAKHAKCNSAAEGGCVVDGDWQDYKIAGADLCSSDWKFSEYSCDA